MTHQRESKNLEGEKTSKVFCVFFLNIHFLKLLFIYLFIMQETQVQSLGQEDPLEKGMATHSSILS